MTLAVGAATLALLAGALLGLARELPRGAKNPALAEVAGGLMAGEPAAWTALGAVLLVTTTLVRLSGMAVELGALGRRRAAVAALLVLGLLLVTIVRALV